MSELTQGHLPSSPTGELGTGRGGSTLPHFVNQKPFDPYDVERSNPALEKVYMASQWRMMWLRFRRHRVAIFCGVLLALMYLAILCVEFLAPYSQHSRNVDYIYTPPQQVHLFHEGEFVGPFVYSLDYRLDMDWAGGSQERHLSSTMTRVQA